jgi:DNA-binding winged helix-turn-helix (wHTH) protein
MVFVFDDFELDPELLELRRAGRLLDADRLVLRLLVALVRNAGRLVPKEELVEEVWQGRVVADNVITVCMARLRRTLEDRRGEKEIVATVYGRGYRFARPVVERGTSGSSQRAASDLNDKCSPFVGRQRVLARLRSAFVEARGGRGSLCVLMGEPGIGKTHAVEAFVRELPKEARVTWGFCRETGDTPPLWPWLRMLEEVLAAPGNEALREEAQMLALPALRAGSSDADPTAMTGEERWQQGQERHRTFDAIARLLARAAQSAPWLFIIEDLHRADAATLELLLYLLGDIAHQHIVVVATVRATASSSAGAERARLAQALGDSNCERIGLERLSEEEVCTYVASLLDDPERTVGRTVFRRSEGNPFFMAELCRQLRVSDVHERNALILPQAALEIVREHVARLDGDARGVLSAAAVIGRTFELSLLQATTEREMGSLMASLDSAIAAEVVIAAPDSATGFAFGHELLRSVLYDALAPGERRRWHGRIASVLEQRALAGESVPPSELAYHFHAALPECDRRSAVHYCRLAARAAAGSFANADVLRYVRHALEALELMEQPSMRMRMHLTYVTAMYARGEAALEYERATHELARLARKSSDGPMLVRAALMFNLHPGFRQLSGAADHLERALELLPQDDVALRSVAIAALAVAAPTCFSANVSAPLLSQGLALARSSGSRAALYAALVCRLYSRGGPDHEEEAASTLEELGRLAQRNPTRTPVLPVDLALYRAIRALQRGELEAAASAAETAVARCRQLHHGEFLWHAQRMRALVELNAGNPSRALSELRRLHQVGEQQRVFGVAPFRAYDKALLLAEFGDPRELTEEERDALAYALHDPPALWSLKLRALVAAGLKDAARATLYAVAPSALADLPCDRDLLGTLGHVAYSAALLGAHEHAEAAANRLRRYRDHYAAHVGFVCDGAVPQILGAVALATGNVDAAVRELESGLKLADRAGLKLCAAYGRLSLGRALTCQGHAREGARARSLISDARAAGERLGMQRLTQAAATALRELPL